MLYAHSIILNSRKISLWLTVKLCIWIYITFEYNVILFELLVFLKSVILQSLLFFAIYLRSEQFDFTKHQRNVSFD